MLSDATLRNIKPEAANYKLADRDGMYVTVTPKGTITFRFDYRINGRRETLTIGRYGARRGMSLQMARELCVDARRAIAEGRSPVTGNLPAFLSTPGECAMPSGADCRRSVASTVVA